MAEKNGIYKVKTDAGYDIINFKTTANQVFKKDGNETVQDFFDKGGTISGDVVINGMISATKGLFVLTVPTNTAKSINDTIAKAADGNYYGIFIPKAYGEYVIDTDIIVKSGIAVYSDGAVIKPSGDLLNGFPLIRNEKLDATGYSGDKNIIIDGLVLDANNKNCTGVALAHTSDCIIRNTTIKNITGATHGMDLAGNRNLIVEHNYLENCKLGGVQVDACMTGSIPVKSVPNLKEDNTKSLNIKIVNNHFNTGGSQAVHLHKEGHTNISIIDNYFSSGTSAIADDDGYTTSHNNVKIVNNYFECSDGNLSAITLYAGHNNLHIDNNTFSKCKNAILLRNDDGTQPAGNSRKYNHLKITNNTIDTCTNSQISCANIYKGLIEGNTIKDFGKDSSGTVTTGVNAIDILTSSYVKISNNEIYNSTQKALGNGVNWGPACDNIIVSENNIINTENGVYANDTIGYITVSNNTIRNCAEIGIFLQDATPIENVVISGNKIIDTKDFAIRTLNTEGIEVVNNNVNCASLSKAGISLNTTEKGVINGNSVVTNAIGISLSSNSGTKIGFNSVIGNVITAPTTGIEILNGSQNNIISLNIVKGGQISSDIDASNINVNNKIV